MNKFVLDLNKFFIPLKDEIYCIIKLRDFPHYSPGSDIDIFCYDIDKFAQNILRLGKQYVYEGFEITSHRLHNGKQIHIDFLCNGKIEFRFDLYANLPHYNNVRIKESYFESVIENRISKEISSEECTYCIFIPSEVDDLIIRYVEYVEWFSQVPDKVGHVEYIMSRPGIMHGEIPFIDKLHHYIALPECPDNDEPVKVMKRPSKPIINKKYFYNFPRRGYLIIRNITRHFLKRISSYI